MVSSPFLCGDQFAIFVWHLDSRHGLEEQKSQRRSAYGSNRIQRTSQKLFYERHLTAAHPASSTTERALKALNRLLARDRCPKNPKYLAGKAWRYTQPQPKLKLD